MAGKEKGARHAKSHLWVPTTHLFTFLLGLRAPTAQDWGVSVLTFGFQGNLPNHRLWNKKGRDVSYVSSWSTSDMAVTTAHLKGDMSEERPGDRNITVGPHFRVLWRAISQSCRNFLGIDCPPWP